MQMAVEEREAVVYLGRPLDRVLGPSAGNHEYRLVMRGGHQTGSPSLVVGILSERKVFVTIAINDGYLARKMRPQLPCRNLALASRKLLLLIDLREIVPLTSSPDFVS